ncbi:MAG: hypothetical protein LBT53_03860, partial [Puniceicoccales bacterium]|nr:hypothetical protein [Puniceicoccales bacterium]
MDSKKTPTTGQEVFRRCRPAAPARTKTPTTPAATTTTAATTTAGRSAKEPPAGVSRSSLGEEKWPRRRGRGEFNLKTAVGGEVLREDVVADAPDGFVKAHLLVRRTKPTSADAPAASARRPDSTAVFRFNISSLVLGVSLCAITVLLAIFARDIIFPPPIKPPPDQTIYLSNASNSRPSERSELGERNERSERNERDGDVERKFLPRNIIKLQPPKRKLSVKAPAHSDTSTSATSNGTAKTSLEIEQATPEQEPPATRRIRAFSGRVPALRIAVYHDISDRMQPYSESIRRYIYEQFPDADIFEFDGAFIHVRDNRVVGGANGKNKPTLGSAAKIIKETAEEKDEKRRKQLRELMGIKVAPTALPKMREEVRKYYVNHLTVEQHAYYEANLRQGEQGDVFLHLSDQGREIYRRYAQNFRDGSLGAWTDIMMYENYDALIIFSDFHPRIQNEKTSLAETPPPAESAPAGEKVPSGEKVPHGEKALIGEKVPSGEKVSHGEKTQIGEKVPLPAKAPVAETPPHSEKVSVGKKALIAEEAPLPAKAPVGETPPHGEKALIAEETPLPAKAPVA